MSASVFRLCFITVPLSSLVIIFIITFNITGNINQHHDLTLTTREGLLVLLVLVRVVRMILVGGGTFSVGQEQLEVIVARGGGILR